MEKEIFKSKRADEGLLISYGFDKAAGAYSLSVPIDSGAMILWVTVKGNEVHTSVWDSFSKEEYILYKVAAAQGEYIGKIRGEIKDILCDISEKCFITQTFLQSSTKTVFVHCRTSYGCAPEYLFDASPDCAVFRRQDTKKWFAVVMKIKRDRLGLDCEGECEIVNLHAKADTVPALIDNKAIFPAYHMNKKHWITVLLEGGITDDLLRSLIDVSYCLGKK